MRKNSLIHKLVTLFCVTSLFPIVVLSIFSYYRGVQIINSNTREMNDFSVKQAADNISITLESYDDILYQMYTNDEMILWMDKLNSKTDEEVTVNQMRRYIRGILNSKDYIRAITVITNNGSVVTYDQNSAKTYQSSWIDNYSMDKSSLYDEIISDYHTHIFPTEYATTFANQDIYLFHMGHRIIDYKNLDKECGTIIISLDVSLLQSICQSEDEAADTFHFITDSEGRIISYKDVSLIGRFFSIPEGITPEEAYSAFFGAYDPDVIKNPMLSVYEDDKQGFVIYGINNQSKIISDMRNQQGFILSLSVVLVIVAVTVMARTSSQIVQRERETLNIQKNAEIKALESQINPHFLYNTLDTINWMAIEQNAFDISNAISTLAKILRYAISDSNRMVTVAEEAEWLKRYVYLQQFRLKESFGCDIHIAPDIQDIKIHKLLLQPFVENAILHGFQDTKSIHTLSVSMEKNDDNELIVEIEDNGKGIEEAVLRQIREESVSRDKMSEKHHIGMLNAMIRIRMYYGDEAEIKLSSVVGEGTKVQICIPVEE